MYEDEEKRMIEEQSNESAGKQDAGEQPEESGKEADDTEQAGAPKQEGEDYLAGFDLPAFLEEIFGTQEKLEKEISTAGEQAVLEKTAGITPLFDVNSRKPRKETDAASREQDEKESAAKDMAAGMTGEANTEKTAEGRKAEGSPEEGKDRTKEEKEAGKEGEDSGKEERDPAKEERDFIKEGKDPAKEERNSAKEGKDPLKEEKNSTKEAGHRAKGRKKKISLFRKLLLCGALGLTFGIFAGIGYYAVWQYAVLPRQEAANQEALDQAKLNLEEYTETLEQQFLANLPAQEPSASGYVTADVSDMVADVIPTMVSIVSNALEEGTDFFGREYSEVLPFSASGIILGESQTELLVATNYHVVENAVELEVTFVDGYKAKAQVKGTDSDMDLAVIAISLEDFPEKTRGNISFAKLGNSDQIKMGEPVIAIGNSLGYGLSMTGGYVSAPERKVTMEDGTTGIFIQTDAAINPGNSGGALLNMRGEVVGINSSKIGDTLIEGVGFAIPISAAKPIISDLMSWETRQKVSEEEKGYIGIAMMDMDPQFIQMYEVPAGILIDEVTEGSPAEAAGLYAKDILVRFDGRRVTSIQEFQKLMEYYPSGTEVAIVVMRLEKGSYQELELQLTLGSWPESTE